MRTTRHVKLFLGPLLASCIVSAAIASPHKAPIDLDVLLPAIALLTMLLLSFGTFVWTRRERRRTKRED